MFKYDIQIQQKRWVMREEKRKEGDYWHLCPLATFP